MILVSFGLLLLQSLSQSIKYFNIVQGSMETAIDIERDQEHYSID